MFGAKQGFWLEPSSPTPTTRPFIFDVDTSISSALPIGQFRASVRAPAGTNITVDWGDGTSNVYAGLGATFITADHTYPSATTYTISISAVRFEMRPFAGASPNATTGQARRMTNIKQWGDVKFTSMIAMFAYTDQPMVFTATDQPDLSECTNFLSVFLENKAFNSNIAGWDISNVTSLTTAFSGATSFNQDISSWNTSKVTSVVGTFAGATSFNQPIGNWNLSNTSNISNVFNGAVSFNQAISWDTSNVLNTFSMFRGAIAFNQPLNNLNMSKVVNASAMFSNASSFNQDISSWNVGNIRSSSNINLMFANATSYNQNLSTLVFANVTTQPTNFSGGANSAWIANKATQFPFLSGNIRINT